MELTAVFRPPIQTRCRARRGIIVKQDYQQELIRYRLERSRETFEEALLMQREQHWNSCSNRLYYSCFCAVTALLAKKGLSSSKHTGVKALFNQHCVKTGEVSRENGSLYNQLFEARQEGDYVDFVSFDRNTIEPWIPQVKAFIETISHLADLTAKLPPPGTTP